MTPDSKYLVDQLLLPAGIMFFLVWSLIGAVIGAGLIVCSPKMFRLFRVMNHYVSTRHGFKAFAMPHDIGQSVRRHRRLVGALFVLGAAYSIFGLVLRFDNSAIVSAMDLRYPPAFVAWILESARWFLILFSMVAIAVGIMLGYFPDSLNRLEARLNHWNSGRKLTLGMDTMHLTPDKWVEAFPRSAGSIIVAGSIYLAANASILWFGLR